MEDAAVGPEAAIGLSVARFRAASGLSQQQVADQMRELGWRWVQPTVWSIEQGRRPLRLAEAADLAGVLGTEMDAFLASPDEDPIERLIAGLVSEVAVLRRRRDDAEARLHEVLMRREALADLARAREGQPVGWPDGPARLWTVFGWIDSAEVRDVLVHLGVGEDEAQSLADAHEGAQANDVDPAAPVVTEFTGRAWAALRQALPTLSEAEPA